MENLSLWLATYLLTHFIWMRSTNPKAVELTFHSTQIIFHKFLFFCYFLLLQCGLLYCFTALPYNEFWQFCMTDTLRKLFYKNIYCHKVYVLLLGLDRFSICWQTGLRRSMIFLFAKSATLSRSCTRPLQNHYEIAECN